MDRDLLLDLVSLADELAFDFPMFASLLSSQIERMLPDEGRLEFLLAIARDLNYASPGVAEFILAQARRSAPPRS